MTKTKESFLHYHARYGIDARFIESVIKNTDSDKETLRQLKGRVDMVYDEVESDYGEQNEGFDR